MSSGPPDGGGAALGRALLAAPVVDAARLEQQGEQSGRFAAADRVLGEILDYALRGEGRAIEVSETRHAVSVHLPMVSDNDLRYLREAWAVERHQKAGFWQIPDALTVHVGLVNLAYYQRRQPALFSVLAFAETAKLETAGQAEAIYLWAQLEPLLELLFAPIRLRGPGIIQKPGTRQRGWAEFSRFANAISLDVDPAVQRMHPGSRWLGLSRTGQIEAKALYLDLLRTQVTGESATLLRAAMLRPLIERYYAKANDGRALRKSVLTRDLQRVLSGYFAGDWLAFLDYLGEQPHPEEEFVSALPEPRVTTATTARAEEVAAETGVSPADVSAIVAAFWGDQHTASPPERRIAALKRFWTAFDQLHAQQRPGMPSLQGLVAERGKITIPGVDHGQFYVTPVDAYTLVPAACIDELTELWGTAALPRYPDRIVGEPFPLVAAARAFGTPLLVWHALGMAAWAACEAMQREQAGVGLPTYYFDLYRELQHTDTPIGRNVLDEMRAALPRLGKPGSIDQRTSRIAREVEPGVEIGFSVTFSGGLMRRDGFEILRDIVTRHRRAWAEQYLDAYLASAWPTDLREAAEEYNRLVAEKGKPPTAKQFARIAETPANAWFGGDLATVYAAIGAKSPVRSERVTLMPRNRVAFAWRVFDELGGRATMPERPDDYSSDRSRFYALEKLADGALRYVQLQEALGRPPELSEFGRANFQPSASRALDNDTDRAWSTFASAVGAALDASVDDQPPPASLPVPRSAGSAQSSKPHQSLLSWFFRG